MDFCCALLAQEVCRRIILKTVGSDAWTIFVKAIFANFFINVASIIAMQLGEDYSAKFLPYSQGSRCLLISALNTS